ncbi:MAG: insulinase family protein [Verrucomicrobia bacterium]|nr:insulinase family protein [Verrucomicrobiota bacterium]
MIYRPVLIVAALIAFAFSAAAQKVPVTEKTLSNGMKLLLVQRDGEPTVSGGWVAHVGSSNERPGITGIAHLFEHMMFKGTPTIGTKDESKDREIIADQERVREEMRREEAKLRAAIRRGEIDDLLKPENKSARYKELEAEFKKLVDAQREILVKNEFDRIYTTGGASGMNAFTSDDMTAYFIDVPANKLELWMWMESERIHRPVFREFYAERDVVFEERRMRTEATPTGRLSESFQAMVWESHPYSWPTVGWPSDIPAISKAQADEFYKLYYAPQNLTLILVGDFKAGTAAAMAEKYFSRIPRGPADAPDVVTLEIKQPAEKRMTGEADANPQVDIAWHTVPFGHPDSSVLRVIGQLLSTRTGRLYKGLVLGRGVATEAYAQPSSQKWAGLFYAGGEAKDGSTPAQVEQAIYEELDRLKTEEVPAQELQKVKNNFAASEYRRLAGGNHALLMQLIQNEGLGDWREINTAGSRIQAVTAADIQRVAKKYFTKEQRNVLTVTRKPDAKDGAPSAAPKKGKK